MTDHDALSQLLALAVDAARERAADALGPLLAYDRDHSGDLVRTLQIYLATGCNTSRAAEELYLHRSGMLYRLRRIEELLAVRLDDIPTRTALELALLSQQAG